MSWNDDIKKIMAILPQIEDIKTVAERTQRIEFDDSQIRRDIERLSESVSKIANNLLSIKRAESSARTYQELNQNMESRLGDLERELTNIKSKPEKCTCDTNKIHDLISEIKNQDPMVYLKRAESSARTCEELMISMEQKVNDLSKRLKNGN